MKVKEYAKNKGVSVQSVYDRLRRGTLDCEMIDGVKHIMESSSKVKVLNVPLNDVDQGCFKKLDKALKKALKHKHRLDIERVKLKSMTILLRSKEDEIDTLKKSLSMIDTVITKKLLQISAPIEDNIIEVKPDKIKKKKKDKKKSKNK